MKIRLLVFLLAIGATAAIAVVIIAWPDDIGIGFQLGSINYPMMYAVQEGFFDQALSSYKVHTFTSATDGLDALLGGTILLNAVIPIQNIAEIEREHPGTLGIAALLISDENHPLDYLIAGADSGINLASDLEGKTVVVFPGSYAETVTRLTLEKIGINNVSFIKRAATDMPQAIQTGEADAGVLYDPAATLAIEQGWGKLIETAFWERNLIPELVVGAYTYNAVATREEPELKQRLLSALRLALDSARENPEAAKSAIVNYFPQFAPIIDDLPDARVEFANEVDYALVEQTLLLYEQNGIIEEVVDLRPALNR